MVQLNPVPVFGAPPPQKKTVSFDGNFSPKFPYNGRRSRKELNSHWNGLGHQHGRRFIVLRHQFDGRDRFFFYPYFDRLF